MIQKRITSGYVLDTCVIVALKDYPRDIFGLIDDIQNFISQRFIVAPKQVFEELKTYAVEDWSLAWAKRNQKMFEELDVDQIIEVKAIVKDFPKLIDERKTTDDADPFIIALARSRGWTVVTLEKVSNNPEKPKIPDVCKNLGVECIDLFELCRKEGWAYKSAENK
jgi:hypothetical protein